MLYNIKLEAGIANTLGAQGRFINVVLAGGEVVARITVKDGFNNIETKLVSGMAFPVNDEFISVTFISPVTQQIKVWLSYTPLTYAPIDAKAVGSSALESISGQVFSGVGELLPAQSGRNKITITPQKDILIGGTGLNAQNGIPVKAGQTFSMQTQGQVLAYDGSGEHAPLYTVNLTQEQMSAFEFKEGITDTGGQVSGGNVELSYFVLSNDGRRLFGMKFGFTQGFIFDFETMELTNVINGLTELDSKGFVTTQGKAYYLGDGYHLQEVDLETMATTRTRMSANSGFEYLDAHAGKFVAMTYFKGNPRVSIYHDSDFPADESGYWAQTVGQPVITDVGNNFINGIQLAPNGDIYVCTAQQIIKSTDDGQTWTSSLPPVEPATENGFKVCKKTGYLWLFGRYDNKLHRSIDGGITWESIISSVEGNLLKGLSVVAGRVYVTGRDELELYSENGVLVSEVNTPHYMRYTVSVCSNGVVVASSEDATGYENSVLLWRGEEEKTGGIPVAIMQEVN